MLHSNPVLWGSKQVCVLVFYGCCVNLLQSGGLKQHDEFSHTFGGLKSKVKVLHYLWTLLGEVFPASSGFWWLFASFLSMTHGHITSFSASIFTSPVCVCLCIFSSAISTLVVGFGPIYIIQDSLTSGSLTSAKTLSPNSVPSRGSRYLDVDFFFFWRPPSWLRL